VELEVRLQLAVRATLLEFVQAHAADIGEFDDEDEIYLAVMAVVAKIEQQLRIDGGRWRSRS
jgi:hypothetical protein